MQVPVAWAVAADARGKVQPTTGLAGQADGVLHGAVSQPARVAPVQPLAPGLEELVEGGKDGALLLAHLLGFMEVESVLPAGRLVGEHDAWGQTGHSAGSAGSPPTPSPAPAGATGVPDPTQIQALRQGPPQGGTARGSGRQGQGCSPHAAASGKLPATSGGTGAHGHTDIWTTVLGTHRPWSQGDMDHPCGDRQTIVMGMHQLQEQGHKDQHHGGVCAMIPGHWTTNMETDGTLSRG